jgi:hypothetical protein
MGIDWGGGGTLEGNGCGWWTGSCTSVCWMGQCPASVHGAALHVREGALQWREPSEGKEVVGEEQYCRGGLGGRQVCCAGPSWDAAVIYMGEHMGGVGILGKEYVGAVHPMPCRESGLTGSLTLVGATLWREACSGPSQLQAQGKRGEVENCWSIHGGGGPVGRAATCAHEGAGLEHKGRGRVDVLYRSTLEQCFPVFWRVPLDGWCPVALGSRSGGSRPRAWGLDCGTVSCILVVLLWGWAGVQKGGGTVRAVSFFVRKLHSGGS